MSPFRLVCRSSLWRATTMRRQPAPPDETLEWLREHIALWIRSCARRFDTGATLEGDGYGAALDHDADVARPPVRALALARGRAASARSTRAAARHVG